ncbi:MAG: hypothetical protein H0W74_04660 [Sphingosinicella sp.]|nr:hypothetical protein [Sphingosinicella sp.]
MIPRLLIDTAELPGGGELRLFQRGEEFSIMLGANELMNSRLSGSEEALASLTAARIGGRARPRILIGGLGMGFTLRAALAEWRGDCDIVVAELVPAIIDWARGPLAHFYGQSLTDARVTVVEGDVGGMIGASRSDYDAILLDVDNGPHGLTIEANNRLYGSAGLADARSALKPGGIFAIWSSSPDPKFSARLRKAGFDVTEEAVRARKDRGARHLIWIAAKI